MKFLVRVLKLQANKYSFGFITGLIREINQFNQFTNFFG